MELIEYDGCRANVSISFDELVILNNALNEVCNGLDQFDFETRIGAKHEEVVTLFKSIGLCLDKLENVE